MSSLYLVLGTMAVFIALCVLANVLWKKGGFFESMFFIDCDEGASVLWVEESLATAGGGGYLDPQLVQLSMAESRRRLIYTGTSREQLVLLGDSGRFLWWWSSRLGLHTRDRSTGTLLLSESALLKKVPQLQGKLFNHRDHHACNNYVLDWPSRGVRLRANDGRVWAITADLSAALSDTPWVEVDQSRLSTRRPASVGSGNLRDGRTIAFSHPPDRRKLTLVRDDLDASYLEGELVWDCQHGRVMELDAPLSVVVVHRDKLGSGANLLISRVALDGVCMWTRSEADYRARRDRDREVGELAFAATRADGLYLVINRHPYCVLAVDPQAGDVLQRFST